MIGKMILPFVIRDATISETLERESHVLMMDEEEFRAFYDRTARPLWAYLSRITGDRNEADDVLQEAFYRFYRAGARHESESHRRNSLFQIATNIVRDSARRAKHHEDVPLEEESWAGETPRSQAPVPERQASIRTDLERGMKQLDPLHREMLWLAYAQGSSHEEIAETLGVRTVSVRTTLLRARRKLAGILSEGRTNRSQEAAR